MRFKVFRSIKIEELEDKLNEITKSGLNVVQVLNEFYGDTTTYLSIVAVGGQPWKQEFEPEEAKSQSVSEIQTEAKKD